MDAPTHTWKAFKAYVDGLLAENRALLFRGQSKASWGLVPTYYRLAAPLSHATYWNAVLPLVHDYITTWSGRGWDLTNNVEKASFVGFLQHNGFPTPLLDWTRSPYAAAYFAFEGVQNVVPQSEHVSIFAFDNIGWNRDWSSVLDVSVESSHVSVLYAESRGNHKQLLQQGVYTYSTVTDQEFHIRSLERGKRTLEPKHPGYLQKITLAVEETPLVMRDLSLMGISAMTLDPGVQGVCKHLREMLFQVSEMNQNKQRIELLENLRRLQEELMIAPATGNELPQNTPPALPKSKVSKVRRAKKK